MNDGILTSILSDETLDILKKYGITFYEGSAEMQLPIILKRHLQLTKICLIAGENDDVNTVTFIENLIKSNGYVVTTTYIHVSGNPVQDELNLSYETGDVSVIAVGSQEVINATRYYAYLKNVTVIAIPLTPKIKDILSPKAYDENNFLSSGIPLAIPKAVLLDLGFIASANATEIRDAYYGSVTKILDLIDYKYQSFYYGGDYEDTWYSITLGAVTQALKSLGSVYVTEQLLKSQILLAIMGLTGKVVYCGGEFGVSSVLKKYEPSLSTEECEFIAFCTLVEIYCTFCNEPCFDLPIVPKYSLIAETLSSVFGFNFSRVIENINIDLPLSRQKQAFFASVRKIIGETEKAVRALPRIKDFGKNLLKENKNYFKFTASQLQTAVKTGAYIGGKPTLIRLIADLGYLDYENGYTESYKSN